MSDIGNKINKFIDKQQDFDPHLKWNNMPISKRKEFIKIHGTSWRPEEIRWVPHQKSEEIQQKFPHL